MNNPIKQLVFIPLLAAVAAGCASAPSQFYTLNATANGDPAVKSDLAVIVGPVTIPAEVNRPQFTVQIAPNRVAVDEFNRWAAPLGDNIARVIAGDLSAQLGTPQVSAVPLANFAAAWRVTISIQRFESVPGRYALVDAVWVVHGPAAGAGQSGSTVVNEPVSGGTYDALAAAHSRALAKVSADIAAALRKLADVKP